MKKKLKFLIEKNNVLAEIFRAIYRATMVKYKNKKQNRLFIKKGKDVLFGIDSVFKEIGVDYWLIFGTLLGAIREKGFISHDIDIDLGMWARDYSIEHEKFFNRYGFKKKISFIANNGIVAREDTYEKDGIYIDIFYFFKKDDKMVCHTFLNKEGYSWDKTIQEFGGLLVRELSFKYAGFSYINLFNKQFMVPKNYKEHLEASYGKNYMKPDPNYSNDIATNAKILPNIYAKKYNY